MPALGNIGGVDAEASPVTHTFKPKKSVEGDVAVFTEAGSTALEDKRLTVRYSRDIKRGTVTITQKLAWPIAATQTINGVSSPLLQRTAYVDVVMTFSEQSLLQERKNAISLSRSLLTDSTNKALHEALEGYY
jgi:vacuolar-type H+-ATPase catalytic subunit A/Vma1